MSGAVDVVKKVAEAAVTVASPVGALAGSAIHNVGKKIVGGESPSASDASPVAIGRGLVDQGKDITGSMITSAQSIGLLPTAGNVPNIGVQDPKLVKAQNDAARAAAARQAQIDQMTGAPGRGGTILTDSYKYNT